jgi:predicted transcriptional regulator of viral defense system
MNYHDFKNKVQNWPLIYSRDLMLPEADKQVIRNQLERWQAKKLLIKLKKGIFLLNPNDRKITPSRMFIANQLYFPSYVSLEYALGFYGLIPERVSNVTSVTTKKTQRLKNELGEFVYQHIKPEALRGFRAQKDESGLNFFIAEPEKAIVDFCYLNLKNFTADFEGVFEENYRFQNLETLDIRKLTGFARLFNSGKLVCVISSFCGFVKKEKKRE